MLTWSVMYNIQTAPAVKVFYGAYRFIFTIFSPTIFSDSFGVETCLLGKKFGALRALMLI